LSHSGFDKSIRAADASERNAGSPGEFKNSDRKMKDMLMLGNCRTSFAVSGRPSAATEIPFFGHFYFVRRMKGLAFPIQFHARRFR